MEASGGSIGGSVGGDIQASLAGRYASALFEIARDARTIDSVEAGLTRVRDAVQQSDDFRRLTTSPLVSRTEARRAVQAAAGPLGLDQTTANFLGVLAENRRLGQLPAIVRAFRLLASRHRGETTAEVTSAHPLTEDQVVELKQQLRARLGREVSVDLSVDPELLGGLVVRIGSTMIDSSIRTRLNTLAHAMKG
ncbi:F0F1 ATP synthase subunit delta [Sphingomonas lenta]|uniref:F0F1 ATP synthase subunit delta n=1 Tax=Sphingomonas lenta TaxID=1141887 RepID=UPI001FE34D86|nr:F0F1 ATP synthase subunit delta [Sphingomonas lenta]